MSEELTKQQETEINKDGAKVLLCLVIFMAILISSLFWLGSQENKSKAELAKMERQRKELVWQKEAAEQNLRYTAWLKMHPEWIKLTLVEYSAMEKAKLLPEQQAEKELELQLQLKQAAAKEIEQRNKPIVVEVETHPIKNGIATGISAAIAHDIMNDLLKK